MCAEHGADMGVCRTDPLDVSSITTLLLLKLPSLTCEWKFWQRGCELVLPEDGDVRPLPKWLDGWTFKVDMEFTPPLLFVPHIPGRRRPSLLSRYTLASSSWTPISFFESVSMHLACFWTGCVKLEDSCGFVRLLTSCCSSFCETSETSLSEITFALEKLTLSFSKLFSVDWRWLASGSLIRSIINETAQN